MVAGLDGLLVVPLERDGADETQVVARSIECRPLKL